MSEEKDGLIETLQLQVSELLRINAELTGENSSLKSSLSASYEENRQWKAFSMIDPLTELWNRRGLKMLIDAQTSNITPPGTEEQRRRKSAVESSVALMLDVDFFKEINEAHTHAGGDQVLRHVAHALRASKFLNAGMPHSIRKSDVVGRWGGDEFIIYLYGASLEEMILRLKDTDGRLRIHVPPIEIGGKKLTITLSGGLVECHFQEPLEAIAERASTALFVAKGAGRNQIHLAA